ncbi:MAG: flagellar biosynthetic protein FliO [Pirellula sp.]|nr:flagellar biosynthetic protein FliO [Pirellula sp.]
MTPPLRLPCICMPFLRARWMIASVLVFVVPSVALGQLSSEASGNRIPPVRVHTPSTVVQASANLPSTVNPPAAIPMKKSSETSTGRMSAPRSPWASTLSTFASLAMVVFLFLGAALILRKSQPRQFQKLPKEVVEVLGRTSLGPRQSLVVLRFGSKLILVSQQPGETQSIGEIQDPNEAARLMGLCESERPESISSSFRDVFNQVVQSRAAKSL